MIYTRALSCLLLASPVAAFALQCGSGITITEGVGQRGGWSQQVEQFKRLLADNPESGEYWHQLAYAEEMSGKQSDAVRSYQKSIERAYKVPESHLGIARVAAANGQKDQALAAIRQSVLAGLRNRSDLLNEPLFNPYLHEPSFLTSVDYLVNPVHRFPDGDALAFWLGEWRFHTLDGLPGGFSRVAAQDHGFSVVENWTSADGTTARSVYTYDKNAKKWTHTWSGPHGEISRRTVKRTKEGLEMVGISTYPDGAKLYEREILRRLPDGKIEQTVYQSLDGGETWIEVSKGHFTAVQKPATATSRTKNNVDSRFL